MRRGLGAWGGFSGRTLRGCSVGGKQPVREQKWHSGFLKPREYLVQSRQLASAALGHLLSVPVARVVIVRSGHPGKSEVKVKKHL